MDRSLELAYLSLNLSSPNPRVGCYLQSPDGKLIGEGHTQEAGGAHAEIMALRDAQNRGISTIGSTAYVTLEPCSHHGRTGPCCDALIAAGIKRVVASIADPNPLVAGRGFERLRAAGLMVEIGSGAAASIELNIGFFSRMIRKSPWVRMKSAASLDGTTALSNGKSQWITSPMARADGHTWRARSCAVLTGIGTLLHDNPRLDVRLIETPRQPYRVVVDSMLQIPLDAAILKTGGGPVWIYTATRDAKKETALAALGTTVTLMPDNNGKVDLAKMMTDLSRRGINELHVEAGSKLNGSLIRLGLVDEFLIYFGSKLLGQGAPIAQIPELTSLSDAVQLQFISCQMIGDNLRVLARTKDVTRGAFMNQLQNQ